MIKSYVGGHEIKVYSGCIYDPNIRKYRGGELAAVIPYSGKMLSVEFAPAKIETINIGDMNIIVKSPQKFISVDPLPIENESDFFIVSALYVAACKELGKDTSHLLTIGDTVVNENNYIIGCVNFNKN